MVNFFNLANNFAFICMTQCSLTFILFALMPSHGTLVASVELWIQKVILEITKFGHSSNTGNEWVSRSESERVSLIYKKIVFEKLLHAPVVESSHVEVVPVEYNTTEKWWRCFRKWVRKDEAVLYGSSIHSWGIWSIPPLRSACVVAYSREIWQHFKTCRSSRGFQTTNISAITLPVNTRSGRLYWFQHWWNFRWQPWDNYVRYLK